MDLETRWALNAACRGRRRWNPRHPGVAARIHGRTVIRARKCRPLGHSTHGRARQTHLVAEVCTAWANGRLVGSQVRWRCGHATALFELTALGWPMCQLCIAAYARTTDGGGSSG